jgi:hypothetical protein
MVNGIFNSLRNWEKFADEHGQYFLAAGRIDPPNKNNYLKNNRFSDWHGFR